MTNDETTRIDTPGHDGPNADEQLDQLIADYLQQIDNGTAPTRDEFIAACPQFAGGLQEFFADLDHFAGEITIEKGAPHSERHTGDESFPRVRYFGEYELLREIARGGMGVVYEARQKTLKRIVAVKMILSGALASEEDVKRFRTEAQAAAGLQHPGIVSIHEVGVCQGQHYFSMDLVEGCSLADLVTDKALPDEQAARYVKLVAEAVQFAHSQGTLHRDLKPSNILIDRASDEPRITDFGLAKQLNDDSGLTATGAQLGTPSYMSPEQAAGETDQVGPLSDVYSLGAILYELLTGHPPFRGTTVMQTLTMVTNREPIPPRQQNPAIPRDIETVCLKCLQKSPADRYASAGELAADVGRFLNGEPVRARRAGVIERSRRWLWKHRRMAGLVTVVFITALSVDFGRRKLDEYYESQKASLSFTTDGTPLFARVIDPNSNAVVTEFTSPTAQPVRLAAGDYFVRMSAPGHPSELHRLLVQPEQELTFPLQLQHRSPGKPLRLEGHLRIARLNGKSAILDLRKSGVVRHDAMTGEVMWEFDASDEASHEQLRQANIDWRDSSGADVENPDSRSPQPTRDLNGDDVDDLLWIMRDPAGIVALSGADGMILWAYSTKSETPNPWEKSVKSELLAGQPVATTEQPEKRPDFLLTFQRMGSYGGLKMGDQPVHVEPERWVELIDGSTGKRRWRYTIDRQSYATPSGEATPLPAFIMNIQGDTSVIVPSGRSLIRLNLKHGSEPRTLASFNSQLTSVRRQDLDGDGQQELLVALGSGPNKSKLRAVDAVQGNILWGAATDLPKPESWRVIAPTEDTPAAIAVVTDSDAYGSHGRRTTVTVELLDATNGKRRWLDEHSVSSRELSGALQLYEAPDIDGDGRRDLLVASTQENGHRSVRIAVHAHSIANGKRLWNWSADVAEGRNGPQIMNIQEWTDGPNGLPRLLVSCGRSYARNCPSHVLSARTGQRIAELPAIEEPQLADVDADGRDDLIWLAPPFNPWRQRGGLLHTIAGEDAAIWRRLGEWHPAVDFDGDGVTDLTLTPLGGADSGGPRSVAVSGRDGRVLWQASAESRCRLPLPLPHGDVDGDGGADLFELGLRSTGKRTIYRSAVISGKTGKTIWQTTSDCDPQRPAWAVDGFSFFSLLFGRCHDANQDGRPEIVLGYRTNRLDNLGISVIDGQTGSVLWNTNAGKNEQAEAWLDPLYASHDGGEMIVGQPANGHPGQQLDAWNITTGEKLWTHTTGPLDMWAAWERPTTCAVDLNGDSIREIVVTGSSLTALDVRTNETLWTAGRISQRSRNSTRESDADIPGSTGNHPTFARLASDGMPFVCALSGNKVRVFDANGATQASVTLPTPTASGWLRRWQLQAVDLDGNGDDELLVTRHIHSTTRSIPDSERELTLVTAIDPLEDDPVLWSRQSSYGELLTTQTDKGNTSLVAISEGRTVFGIDGKTGTVRWSCNGPKWWFDNQNGTADFRTYLDYRPTLLTRDSNGRPRVLFRPHIRGVGNHGVECRIGSVE